MMDNVSSALYEVDEIVNAFIDSAKREPGYLRVEAVPILLEAIIQQNKLILALLAVLVDGTETSNPVGKPSGAEPVPSTGRPQVKGSHWSEDD